MSHVNDRSKDVRRNILILSMGITQSLNCEYPELSYKPSVEVMFDA